MTTIYVGNLPFTATEDEVRALFERHGKVESVTMKAVSPIADFSYDYHDLHFKPVAMPQ